MRQTLLITRIVFSVRNAARKVAYAIGKDSPGGKKITKEEGREILAAIMGAVDSAVKEIVEEYELNVNDSASEPGSGPDSASEPGSGPDNG